MSDVTTTQTTATGNALDNTVEHYSTALAPLIKELGEDAIEVKKAIAAYKQGGMPAVLALMPELIAEAQDDIQVIEQAIPTIKSGFATSEFWLAAAAVGTIVGFKVAGHPLSISEEVIIGSLSAVYAIVRGFLKKPATTASK